MALKISQPIVFLDIEATGPNVANDKIVELFMYKVTPDEEENSFHQRFNPEKPIPLEISEIHGIYDSDVVDEPTFRDKAAEICEFLEGCDMAGYNSNRYDVPLLVEEFLRTDVDFPVKDRKLVDVQNIFHKMEQRTLAAAYKFYCGKELEDAHTAEADTMATYNVLLSQLKRYDELENDVDFLHEFSQRNKHIDFMGRITEDKKGRIVFNFGKYKGREVTKVLEKDPGYYGWMMNGDFPSYTKKKLKEIKESMS